MGVGYRWQPLRDLRQEVNWALAKARTEKAIGASLEAKVRCAGLSLRLQTCCL